MTVPGIVSLASVSGYFNQNFSQKRSFDIECHKAFYASFRCMCAAGEVEESSVPDWLMATFFREKAKLESPNRPAFTL
jgi:hypothetical protein